MTAVAYYRTILRKPKQRRDTLCANLNFQSQMRALTAEFALDSLLGLLQMIQVDGFHDNGEALCNCANQHL